MGLERWEEAREALTKAQELADAREDVLRRAEVIKFRGMLARHLGDAKEARVLIGEGLRLARKAGDTLLMAELMREEAELLLTGGDASTARAGLEESLALFERLEATLDAKAVRDRLDELLVHP